MSYFQTGDVLYKEYKGELPTLKKEGNIIYKGENNYHRIKGEFTLFSSENSNDVYIVAHDDCILFHEEHKDVTLPKGTYEIAIVKEYDHAIEEQRNIID